MSRLPLDLCMRLGGNSTKLFDCFATRGLDAMRARRSAALPKCLRQMPTNAYGFVWNYVMYSIVALTFPAHAQVVWVLFCLQAPGIIYNAALDVISVFIGQK